jgi:hypothetical protein
MPKIKPIQVIVRKPRILMLVYKLNAKNQAYSSYSEETKDSNVGL